MLSPDHAGAPGRLRFDVMAVAELARLGWHPEEWMAELQLREDGVDQEAGRTWAEWRQRPDRPPSGAWAMALAVVVDDLGRGRAWPPNITSRAGWTYLPPRRHDGPRGAALIVPRPLPDTLVAAMVGRRVGDVVDGIAPIADAVIATADAVDLPASRGLVIGFDQVETEFDTPWRMYP